MSKVVFMTLVTADQPEAPQYFAYDAMLNLRERPDAATDARPCAHAAHPRWRTAPDERGCAGGGRTRASGFCRAHLHGSLNISLRGSFATWAGTLLKREAPIVLVAEPGCEAEAAMRLGRIGYDHVAGYLDSWHAGPRHAA